MKSKMQIALLTLSPLLLAGCMTFEGPDHKYVLTQEGIKEVEKSNSQDASNSAQTVTPTQTQSTTNSVSNRSKSNYDAARGYCNRYGRGRDPNPWTSFELVINKDVDAAYPKIMREFGYTRWKAPLHYGTSIPVCDVSLRYEEVPGSHYQMRRFLKHAYGNEESENTIEVDLSKEDVGKVRVRVSYYSGNTIDKQGYEASLLNRIKQALR